MKKNRLTALYAVLLAAIPCIGVFSETDDQGIDQTANEVIGKVKLVRIVLPEKSNHLMEAIVSVFTRQVEKRCPAKVVRRGEAHLTVALTIDPTMMRDILLCSAAPVWTI